ncbi:interleukin-1 beta-like [Phyllobates terribilis]|uniref:interleukin-1 beta-like n=1 Tax=Phyllobates terribilis TaxID=111132 RepID=UPI003CCAFE39
MAEVPNLCDLPMDISEEEFYVNDVPNIMKVNKYSYSHEGRVNCISKIKPCTGKPENSVHLLKKVKAFSTIVKKWKKAGGSANQSFFYDDDLLTPVLVNENIVINKVEIEDAPRTRFLHVKSSQHNIRDSKQKSLKIGGNNTLVASFLAGENVQLEVKIKVDTYFEAKPDKDNLPVALGIVGSKLYLCCTTEEGTTNGVLSLAEVDDIKSKADDDLLPFIFYYRKIDSHNNTFESVAIPGYYLSTSQNEGAKLHLRPRSEVFIREFRLTPSLG